MTNKHLILCNKCPINRIFTSEIILNSLVHSFKITCKVSALGRKICIVVFNYRQISDSHKLFFLQNIKGGRTQNSVVPTCGIHKRSEQSEDEKKSRLESP